jgi:hypothetical protein
VKEVGAIHYGGNLLHFFPLPQLPIDDLLSGNGPWWHWDLLILLSNSACHALFEFEGLAHVEHREEGVSLPASP